MEELISVVVPIYNVEKYLQKCIDSILAQTYRHLEIILVDDGSPDNCGAICDNYAQEDGRVLVIHKKNGGLSSARNAGLEIAKGELIVFIDSDDWIDANYIEKLYDDISESGADVAVPAFCIHYCWFGGNPLPQDALMCIESWKKYFPDYEIIEWNEKNFDMNSCDYIREAAENKKWAFVSDFARFKILYDFGGIYFDGAFLKKCGELTQLLADNKRIAVICCQNYGRLMHLRLYKNVNAEIQEEWNAIVEILKQCNYDEDVYKNVLDAVEEYFRTLVQRKKEDKLFELERFMAQVYEENGRCEAAEVAALCLANLYNSGGHRKITPDEYETIKKYLQKFPESMHIRAAFIIASEAIYSPSAEYKRVPDKIINKAKQWSEQYPKKIEFQEAYFGLLFSRLKYAQAQDMRNEQRRVYREMKTVAERANYSEYNESNQLMESVDILHRVFGY